MQRPSLSPLDTTASSLITAVDDLELAARVVVEGLRIGDHRSPFQGAGAEFHQHRPYRVGDDLKHLDWKLFARSDRLYTRRYRESTNVGVMLVVDTSGSMNHPPGAVNSKLRYAVLLAAALAHLATEQGNAVGLMSLVPDAGASGTRVRYVPARSGRVHRRVVMAELDALEPGGQWDPPLAIGRAAELLQRRGLLIVLSDFYDEQDATQRELRHVARHGHDVALLQLVAADERHLPFTRQVEVVEPETGERRLIDPERDAAAYQGAHAAFMRGWQQFAQQEGLDYARFDCDAAPEQTLRDYLLRRMSGASAHDIAPDTRVG
jgi:uncharacterized protein (DUF58 family)